MWADLTKIFFVSYDTSRRVDNADNMHDDRFAELASPHRAHRRCYLRCCYLRLLLPAFVVTCVLLLPAFVVTCFVVTFFVVTCVQYP